MTYLHTLPSPLGTLTLAGNDNAVTGLWIEGQQYFAATLSGETEHRILPLFDVVRDWLDAYFAGKDPAMTLPLAPAGTDFQQAVWRALRDVRYGQTVTYGELAARAGFDAGRYGRAVGGALGHNPISIFIPCHRVVGAGGSITGYAGGIERKRFLLALETENRYISTDLPCFSRPRACK